jgi:nicotinamide N-methyltransferase
VRFVSPASFFFRIAVADRHYRWNAALAIASFLDSNRHLYFDRNVLELGAGGGLPSIVTVKNGAHKVGH